MQKFIQFIYKAKKGIMILFVIITLFAVYGLTQIKIKTDFDIFKTQNSKYLENQKILEENFPSSDQMIVVVDYDESVESKIINFEEQTSELSGIKYVKGLSNIETLPVAIDALSPIKTLDGQSYAVLSLFPDESFNFATFKYIEDSLQDAGLTYYISGDQYMQNKIFDYLLIILLTLVPFAIFILINIFRFQMRSIKATMLSILPAVVAALWTLGSAGLFGNGVSVLTVLAPIFTIIIGSADGLHFISHVQEYLDEGLGMKESLSRAMSMVGVPMIITTVTSVAGFVSLLFLNTAAIHDLAVFTSIGIALAGLITWLILPTINSFEKINIEKKVKSSGITIPFNKMMGWPSYIAVMLIVVAAFFGIPKIKTEFNQLMLYKDHTEVAKSFDKIMEVNEGTIPMFALVENNGDPLDTDVMVEAMSFSDTLIKNGDAAKVVSLYSILDSLQEQMPAGMPPNLNMFSESDFYSEMVSDSYSKIIIFPKDLSNHTIEQIVSAADDYPGIILSGTQLTMYELNRQMLDGQKLSLLIAFIIVFLSLIISLRKFWLSILSILPIVFTTLFMFAFLGLTGISLNLFTTTMFSVTIGVGIDYAIHFTSVFNSYKKSGLNSADAVTQAYSFSSRPITANALGFSIGLSVLMLSPLKIHLYVSLLMWVSMVLSSILSLSFLPTLLKKIK